MQNFQVMFTLKDAKDVTKCIFFVPLNMQSTYAKNIFVLFYVQWETFLVLFGRYEISLSTAIRKRLFFYGSLALTN